MTFALIYVGVLTALALYCVRRSTADNIHKLVCLGYSPFVIISLSTVVLPTYWFMTTGRFAGLGDDLVGLGTVMILFFIIPTTLILNIVIFACRKTPDEVPQ